MLDLDNVQRYVPTFAAIEITEENVQEICNYVYGVYFEDLGTSSRVDYFKGREGFIYRQARDNRGYRGADVYVAVGYYIVFEGGPDPRFYTPTMFKTKYRKAD